MGLTITNPFFIMPIVKYVQRIEKLDQLIQTVISSG